MSRHLPPVQARPHGRTVLASEPLVYHCNFYNYWLQKTLLLDEDLGMAAVIHDAATEVAYSALQAAATELGASSREAKRTLASDLFAELGFGLADFSELSAEGGRVDFAASHYGQMLRQAVGENLASPQTFFDAGFAAAVAAFLEGLPANHFAGTIESCQGCGAKQGLIIVHPRTDGTVFTSPGFVPRGAGTVPPPHASSIDEAAIIQAVSGLSLVGNEEGLIPRFGVALTHHFANFYNRISFEFERRMENSGLLEAVEMLLTDAGYHCAFHTFGGIMTSAEWDAVIRPNLQGKSDWVHAMVAVVNALGWGTYRVVELTDDRLVLRIWDDYESCGYLDMYGTAKRPVSHLACAAAAGMMNLIHLGNIHERPELTLEFYEQCFEQCCTFEARTTKSLAMGDAYTEIVATRGTD